ncbi:MarR family winged helix-turn-helix transcriptional regulator [Jatrophihabitans fulvus]
MTGWLSDDEQRAWRAYLQMSSRLTAHLNRDLKQHADLSLADYDVLVNVHEAPEGGLRAFELCDLLQWEQSRMSHHLRRMTARGLVACAEPTHDRRGLLVTLTDHGRQRLAAAAPAHVATVRRVLFDALDDTERRTLTEIGERVIGRIADDAG